jgi:ribosome modulation factor
MTTWVAVCLGGLLVAAGGVIVFVLSLCLQMVNEVHLAEDSDDGIYAEGYAAGLDGKPNRNPFWALPRLRREWANGYRQGEATRKAAEQ